MDDLCSICGKPTGGGVYCLRRNATGKKVRFHRDCQIERQAVYALVDWLRTEAPAIATDLDTANVELASAIEGWYYDKKGTPLCASSTKAKR